MSLPLVAGLRNATYLEHMPWLEPVYGATLALGDDGWVPLPRAHGWGVSFDLQAVAHFAP